MLFPIVPHEDKAFCRHFEVGPFHSDFILSSVLGPFLRADEDLGRSREVQYLFKIKVVKFTCVNLQFQDNGACLLCFDDPPNAIDFCIVPFF